MPAHPADFIPVKRPHFTLRDEGLVFLISRRPFASLEAGDRALWNHIDGVATIGQLRGVAADADVRLERLATLGVCDLVEPRFPANRRRVLVIEPHMDDAVLSVGGEMWARRH